MYIDQFSAGCLPKQISVLESITSDPEGLQTVKGMRLEFEDSHYITQWDMKYLLGTNHYLG